MLAQGFSPGLFWMSGTPRRRLEKLGAVRLPLQGTSPFTPYPELTSVAPIGAHSVSLRTLDSQPAEPKTENLAPPGARLSCSIM